MKISLEILKRFIDLPQISLAELIDLFEDLGLEVKNRENVEADWWLTLELLANRGDHHCYEGLARELNSRLATGLKKLRIDDFKLKPITHFEILAQQETMAFSLTEFVKSQDICLPAYLAKMLSVSNLNVINLPIDVTNVVNLEIGQPMHVYDADKVKGKIQVRFSNPGEKADLLFCEVPVLLPENSLVIADEEKILSVAGVIGCKGASVDEQTKRFYLEAALFDPVSIRKTSKKLGIQTLASIRFERGGDLGGVTRGIQRAVYLYNCLGWQGHVSELYQKTYGLPTIKLDIREVNAMLDTNLSSLEIQSILKRIAFKMEVINEQELLVVVPTHRVWDVKLKEDLIEEIARVIGYNQLVSMAPPVVCGVNKSSAEQLAAIVNHYLVANGFSEVITDALYSNQALNQIDACQAEDLKAHLQVLNACDKGYSLLRNNTILQAVNLIDQNRRFQNERIKAFEWGKVFLPTVDQNQICDEQERLWGIAVGSIFPVHFQTEQLKVDLLYLKGLLAGLARILGVKWVFTVPAQVPALLHRQKTLAIEQNGETIGYCGEINPKLLLLNNLMHLAPVYFELQTDKLQRLEICQPVTEKILTKRDICLTLSFDLLAGEVIDRILKLKAYPVSQVFLKDIFIKNQQRNITYTLVYQINNTHSAEEINRWTAEIKQHLEKQYLK